MKSTKLLTIKREQDSLKLAKIFAGELCRVEKVKPNPLNLLVNTVVGKQIVYSTYF